MAILASTLAKGNRLKLATISAGVIVAVIFGPIFIENNGLVKDNYDGFLQWKNALLGIPEPTDPQTIDQDAADLMEDADADIMTNFGYSGSSRQTSAVDDVEPEPQPEIMPAVIENDQPSADPSEFDDSNFSILLSDPKKFIGYGIAITGQVYDISRFNNDANFGIFNLASSSPDNSRASIFLQMSNANIDRAAVSSIRVEDCVIVHGRVSNSMVDRNSIGQTIQVPLIEGSSIGKIECIDSALPVYSTIEINDSLSQRGLLLTAQKVQFADDHVRIKLVAENSGSASMFIRDKESFAVQDDRSQQSITHLPVFSEYRLDARIVSESQTEGYLFFEPVDSDDRRITFRIVVEQVGITETVRSVFIFTVE